MQAAHPPAAPDRAAQIQQARLELNRLTTEELLAIWRKNNRQQRSPEVFEAAWLILRERMGGKLEQHRDPFEWLDPRIKYRKMTLTGVQGEFEIPRLNGDEGQLVFVRLSEAITSHSSLKVEANLRRVWFRGSPFPPRREWHILDFVENDEIEVETGRPGALRYRISLWGLLVRIGVGVLIIPLTAPSLTSTREIWILLVPLVFIFIAVIFTILGIDRFHQLIWQTLKHR